MDDKNFQVYLRWLRGYLGPGPVHLVLDLFSVHRSDNTKMLASELGIQLHFVPAGLTDKFQPLDVAVFSPVKSMARRLFMNSYHESPEKTMRMKRADAVQWLLYSCTRIQTHVVQGAWSQYETATTSEN